MLVDMAYEYNPTPYICHKVEVRDSHRGKVIIANRQTIWWSVEQFVT